MKYPELRFGQLLYNLDINQYANQDNPSEANHQLRDIHSDSDTKILSRVKNSVVFKNYKDE